MEERVTGGPLTFNLAERDTLDWWGLSPEERAEQLRSARAVLDLFSSQLTREGYVGMYTGFRADVVVRPEYRAAIQYLHRVYTDGDDEYDANLGCWELVGRRFPDLPGVYEWATVGRSPFIPFGALMSMPREWDDREAPGYSRFDEATGRWEFACSLKNYEGEIDKFVRGVLVHIVSEVSLCESLYEEHSSPSPALPPVALYKLCVEKAAALRGESFEAACGLPPYALSDLLQDHQAPALMVEAARARPWAALYDAMRVVLDNIAMSLNAPVTTDVVFTPENGFHVSVFRPGSDGYELRFGQAPNLAENVSVRFRGGSSLLREGPVLTTLHPQAAAVVRAMNALGPDLPAAWLLMTQCEPLA